jgi:cardiolipin synthase A/B
MGEAGPYFTHCDVAHPAMTGGAPREHPATATAPARPAISTGELAAARRSSALFTRGLWRSAMAAASDANVVQLLRDGPATFACMLQAIDDARHRVDLESYLMVSDETGERFAAALSAAARRGAHVRVLTDWMGSRGVSRHYWRRLHAAKVEVRIFSPPGLRPWFGMLPRDHRKVFVADDRVAITGGIGIADLWRGTVRRSKRAPWRDTGVRITGPAVGDMAAAFDTMWARAAGESTRPRRRDVREPRGSGVDPNSARGAVVGIIEGEPWRMRLARAYNLFATAAERSFWLASAYFFPSDAQLEALAIAAMDGVDVRILVPGASDHPWFRRLTSRTYRYLLGAGVRLWEWKGEMMHAKFGVIDGQWVRVGSTDFNLLGVQVNYELDAFIQDAGCGAAAVAMFEEDLAASREVKRGA